MSHDAYAGLLKLWITPSNRLPKDSPEVDAYVRYANQHDPLSEATRLALGLPTRNAA